jgi:hypothetical protein
MHGSDYCWSLLREVKGFSLNGGPDGLLQRTNVDEISFGVWPRTSKVGMRLRILCALDEAWAEWYGLFYRGTGIWLRASAVKERQSVGLSSTLRPI